MMVGVGQNSTVLQTQSSEELGVEASTDEEGLNKINKDSIYTMTFAMDQKFVEFLDDANFVKPEEILKNLDSLIKNEAFMKMLKDEVNIW